MAYAFILPLRIATVLLALVELGLTAYGTASNLPPSST